MGMGKDLIEKTILDLNLNSRVKILNYVPNNILYSLYRNAAGLVFPTYYEGFGIPILEAMKCKIPFLIGNIGAAPETAGGHGIKVSPFSVEEISEGIKSLLEITDFQIESAFKYANKFSWEKNAIETYKFYQEILG
jgi:Glycosyltransferase